MTRPTLQQACAQYPHRYTVQHVPAWARKPHTHTSGERKGLTLYYAPHYRTDAEWYAATVFPGESECIGDDGKHCQSFKQTWPHGQWLSRPFTA